MHLTAGLCRTRGERLQRFFRLLAGSRGPTTKERQGKESRKRQKTGRKRIRGEKRERRDRKEGEFCPSQILKASAVLALRRLLRLSSYISQWLSAATKIFSKITFPQVSMFRTIKKAEQKFKQRAYEV